MSDSDPFEDLLGGEPEPEPAPRSRRANRQATAARQLESQISLKAAASGRGLADIGGVTTLRRPVTAKTLATVFGHDILTINRRLIDCPFIEQSGRKLYDFKTACEFIIKPRMSPEQFIRTLNSAHLPPEINKAFWDGQRSRVKYKIEAQEAWETEDVLEVFGEVFMTIKDALTTVTEDMRERAKLTDEQTRLFEEAIDELRANLRQKLVEAPDQKRTTSMFDKPLFGAPNGVPEIPPLDDFADEDE